MSAVIGFDTSNYTTSVALFDPVKPVMLSKRRILDTRGKLGLSQSEAVFAHVKNLPELAAELAAEYRESLTAAAYSSRPRDVEGSYMPCFLPGKSAAHTAAVGGNIPVYNFSHQCGHIAAALYSANALHLITTRFAALQFSGGTSEGVIVEPDDSRIIKCTCFSKSLDLKAGQAIDRVGLMLGLKFPAGPELEKLALKSVREYNPKPSVKGADFSLSGIENKCREMINRNEKPCDIARFAIEAVLSAARHVANTARAEYGEIPLVFAGGVMSNSILRNSLSGSGALFAEGGLSSDNAVGIAVLGAVKHGIIPERIIRA